MPCCSMRKRLPVYLLVAIKIKSQLRKKCSSRSSISSKRGIQNTNSNILINIYSTNTQTTYTYFCTKTRRWMCHAVILTELDYIKQMSMETRTSKTWFFLVHQEYYMLNRQEFLKTTHNIPVFKVECFRRKGDLGNIWCIHGYPVTLSEYYLHT